MSLGTTHRTSSPLRSAGTQTECDGLAVVVKFTAVDADTFGRDVLELLPRLQVDDRQAMDGAVMIWTQRLASIQAADVVRMVR